MNIRTVLAIKFVVIIASILLVFSVIIFQFSNIFRENEFNDRLKSNALHTTYMIIDSSEVDKNVVGILYRKKLNVFPYQELHIYDENDSVYFTSSDATTPVYSKIKDEIASHDEVNVTVSDTEYVAFKHLYQNKTYTIIASAIDEVGHERIDNLRYIFIILFCLSILVTAVLGNLFAKQSLKPIHDVVAQVENITENNLHERVNEGNGKDEIAQLAITFNQMLTRIEDSFVLQKYFVANASHEFRTPLTVMKGQIEVLLLQSRKEEDYIKTCQSLIEDINNQIELINGLSDLARANADFPNTKLQNISSIELIIEAIEELKKNKPDFQINFKLNEIPDEEELVSIKGNNALLKSAIINLMDNACKFSEKHSCNVSLSFVDNLVRFNITDNGIGISEEDLKHIFEPFYRSNNTRKISGHGIGLSLVNKIIQLHQGQIKVESKLDVGTKIIVDFPANVATLI